MKKINPIILFTNDSRVNKVILNRARKKKDIVYGGQSVKARIGFLARSTNDYDIFTKKPRQSANVIQKKLDKTIGYNYYYSKPAEHPGTYKVKNLGFDLKKGTKDDESIVDYTQLPKPPPKFVVINGVRYRSLKEEMMRRREILRQKQFSFRHQKDREDLERIRLSQKVFGGKNG